MRIKREIIEFIYQKKLKKKLSIITSLKSINYWFSMAKYFFKENKNPERKNEAKITYLNFLISNK